MIHNAHTMFPSILCLKGVYYQILDRKPQRTRRLCCSTWLPFYGLVSPPCNVPTRIMHGLQWLTSLSCAQRLPNASVKFLSPSECPMTRTKASFAASDIFPFTSAGNHFERQRIKFGETVANDRTSASAAHDSELSKFHKHQLIRVVRMH